MDSIELKRKFSRCKEVKEPIVEGSVRIRLCDKFNTSNVFARASIEDEISVNKFPSSSR